MDTDDLIRRGNTAVAEWLERADDAWERGKSAEAKRCIIAGQKELRMLKSEVINAERQTRAGTQEARAKTNASGQLLGAFAGSKARGHMGRARAAAKRNITSQQLKNADHFRRVKAALDTAILKLDRLKLDIDAGTYNRDIEVEPTTAPPSHDASPRWASDPTGRYDHRYWDGSQWTAHVSTNSVPSVDPMT